MSKFGGGGEKCTICSKTSYPAETIRFEKKPYHVECFKCSTCSKKMESASKAGQFEDSIYCLPCFAKGGFANKQKNITWTKKETKANPLASRFGGGGSKCTVCAKTVYPAEMLKFEKLPYHPDCFTCSSCSKKLTPAGAAKFEDSVFCHKCFKDGGYAQKQAATARTTGTTTSNPLAARFGGGGAKCTICDKTVYPAETLSFEKKVYHSDCFKCKHCDKKLTVQQAQGRASGENAGVYCNKCWSDLRLGAADAV